MRSSVVLFHSGIVRGKNAFFELGMSSPTGPKRSLIWLNILLCGEMQLATINKTQVGTIPAGISIINISLSFAELSLKNIRIFCTGAPHRMFNAPCFRLMCTHIPLRVSLMKFVTFCEICRQKNNKR